MPNATFDLNSLAAKATLVVTVDIPTDSTEAALAICKAVSDPVVAKVIVGFQKGTTSSVSLSISAPTWAAMAGATSEVLAALLNAFRVERDRLMAVTPKPDLFRATRCVEHPCSCACHTGGSPHPLGNHCTRRVPVGA